MKTVLTPARENYQVTARLLLTSEEEPPRRFKRDLPITDQEKEAIDVKIVKKVEIAAQFLNSSDEEIKLED